MYKDQREQDTGNQAPTTKFIADEDRVPFITVSKAANGYYMAAYMEWDPVAGAFCITRSGAVRAKGKKGKQKAINEGESWARREPLEFRK